MSTPTPPPETNHQRVSSNDIDSLFEVSSSSTQPSKKENEEVLKRVREAQSTHNFSATASSDTQQEENNSNNNNNNNGNKKSTSAEDMEEFLRLQQLKKEEEMEEEERAISNGGKLLVSIDETGKLTSAPAASEATSNGGGGVVTNSSSNFLASPTRERTKTIGGINDEETMFAASPPASSSSTINTNKNNTNASPTVVPSQIKTMATPLASQVNVFEDPMKGTTTTTTTSVLDDEDEENSLKNAKPRPHQKRFKITASSKKVDPFSNLDASMTMNSSFMNNTTNSSVSPAPGSPSAASPTGGSASPARPTLMTAPVVQIPLPGLADIFDGVEKATSQEDDNTHLPLQPNVKLVVEPRWELPSALDMPQRLRCDFCLKYDSLCFHCHKKWKDIELPQRRTAMLSRFAELPEGARIAHFFTSCARGDIEFVRMVLKAYPSAPKWMGELVPTKLDMFEIFKSNKSHNPQERLMTTGGGNSNNEDTMSDSWDEMLIGSSSNNIINNNNKIDLELLPPPKFLRPKLLKFIGKHTALHVAVAYDQLDMAQLLIEHSNTLVRSEKKLLAFQLLPENPFPEDEKDQYEEAAEEEEEDNKAGDNKKTEDETSKQEETDKKNEKEREEKKEEEIDPRKARVREWHRAFNSKPQISELILANRARNLRQRKLWEDADKVYARLLKKNARNEHALCGCAKMLYDQGKFDECITQCRDVLQADMFGGVQWIDFDSSTIHYLMESANKQIHDKAHSVQGSALKDCGCVNTDKVKMNLLLKMKQEDFSRFVCPFIDVQSAFILYSAFTEAGKGKKSSFLTAIKNKNLGRAFLRNLQGYVSSISPAELTPQLYANQEIATVLNQLRFQLPNEVKEKWLAPVHSRGFTVVAFCDFDKILVRTIVEARNPAFKKGMFARFRKNTPELIAVVKEFEIRHIEASPVIGSDGRDLSSSSLAPSVWTLIDSSDWEVDESIQLAPQQK